MNKRDRAFLYSTICNIEAVAAVFFWPEHRGVAWWLIGCAISTLISFVRNRKEEETPG